MASSTVTTSTILLPEESSLKLSTKTTTKTNGNQKKKNKKRKKFRRCELCNSFQTLPVSHCLDCSRKMCYRCTYGHSRIKVCQPHTVIPIVDKIVAENSTTVTIATRSPPDAYIGDQDMTTGIFPKVSMMMKPHTERIVNKGKWMQQVIKGIADDVTNELKVQKAYMDEKTLKLTQLYQTKISNLHQSMKNCQNFIHNGGEENILFFGHMITKKAQAILHQFNDELNNHQLELESDKSCVVTVNGYKNQFHIPKSIVDIKKAIFNNLFRYFYRNVMFVEITGFPRRLSVVDGELWCSTWSNLMVFSRDCVLLRTIWFHSSDEVSALIPGNNEEELIVAYYHKGLQLQTSWGKFKDIISSGSFSDITRYESKIYSLEYEENVVLVFDYKENETYEQTGKILLNYDNVSCGDTLFVIRNDVYICSALNHCLYIYGLDGVQKAQYGHYGHEVDGKIPGLLHYPRLCTVDRNGNAVIADCWNKRLQLCTNKGEWKKINLMDDYGEFWDVTFDETIDTMWAITADDDGYQLIQLLN